MPPRAVASGGGVRRLLGCLAFAWIASAAQAQEALRVVVPAPPGGNLDTTARLIAQRLPSLVPGTYLVDNRPGGNTMIGTELVMKAAADGKTLLFAATGIAMVSALQHTPAPPLEELAPVVQATAEAYVVAVPSASPILAAHDLQGRAQARPEGLNCLAVPGTTFIACEQLRERLGGRSTTVRYAGVSPALTALAGGHGDLMFVSMESATKLAATGRIRLLAVSHRMDQPAAVAGLPLIADVWPGFLLEGFSGFFVPARTPAARIRELNRDINLVLAEPDVRAAMREAGQQPVGGSPEQFQETLQKLSSRYGALIQRLNLGYR